MFKLSSYVKKNAETGSAAEDYWKILIKVFQGSRNTFRKVKKPS